MEYCNKELDAKDTDGMIVNAIAWPTPMPLKSPIFLLPRMLRDNRHFRDELLVNPELRETEAQKQIALAANPSLKPPDMLWQLGKTFSMADFNRLNAARRIQDMGAVAYVAAMSNDDYFPPSAKEQAMAEREKIKYVVLEGPHEGVVRNKDFWPEYGEKTGLNSCF